MPTVPRFVPRRGHFIVCGEDALASRVIEAGGLSRVLARSRPGPPPAG